MTIGIKAVSSHSPENFIDNLNQSKKFEANEDFVLNKIGISKLPIKPENQDTSDMAQCAVEKLLLENKIDNGIFECLILITQNPDKNGLPHTSAILHNKLKLNESCVVFDVSLGCSGYVQGLSIIKSFMEAHGFCDGLLVTSDPYSKIVNRNDRDTAMLFGDGASATWVSSNKPLWDIGYFDFGIQSSKNNALCIDMDGYLSMNGRAVFSFASSKIPKSINNVLDKSNLSIDAIDLILLHQGSKYIVETLAKSLGSEGKTPFQSKNTGNTISSSIPFMLANMMNGSEKFILLSGFGVGLSWASCLIYKK